MIIERFFRVIAESKSLLALGSDGEFVLSLALFKMLESLEIKDIDTMIRGLENELKGVAVSEIMVSSPVADVSSPPKVITITEDEIPVTLPKTGTKSKPQTQTKEIHVEKIIETNTSPQEQNNSTLSTAVPKIEEVHTPVVVTADPYLKNFENLVTKIYDRNHDLGKIFEDNITFISIEENKLTWESTAENTDKKQLVTHWGVINMFVKECFGLETKIVNISKKKVVNPSASSMSEVKKVTEPVEVPHSDADVSSMIEDIEMKSSCIAPSAGDTEAAKEKDPSTLLQEPMVREAIALFDPKKVRIKKNT